MYAHSFRFYFTPLSGVLFAFPSRYWFTIGQSGVFSLGGWSPRLQSRFLVPRPTRFHTNQISTTGLSPCIAWFPNHFVYQSWCLRAGPRSLAATWGISVDFFSSGYLDVSVPLVRLPTPMYSVWDTQLTLGGFPHSEMSGSQVVCHLAEPYRRLPRLSSPLTA